MNTSGLAVGYIVRGLTRSLRARRLAGNVADVPDLDPVAPDRNLVVEIGTSHDRAELFAQPPPRRKFDADVVLTLTGDVEGTLAAPLAADVAQFDGLSADADDGEGNGIHGVVDHREAAVMPRARESEQHQQQRGGTARF